MSDGGDGINTNGIGFGNLIETGAKMNMQVREGEARLRRKGRPDYPPPRRDGIVRRLIRRMRGRSA